MTGVILAMEVEISKGWTNLWIECDSQHVIQAQSNTSIITWNIRKRRLNCFVYINTISIHFSHISSEGNQCADKIA